MTSRDGGLGAFVEERRREDNLPAVSLAVVRDGCRLFSGAWGAPVDAAFHLGSLTKLVTAVAALRLRERGRVDLDAPVRRTLPREAPVPVTTPEITLRHLLAHRSGLPRGPYLTNPAPVAERLAGQEPVFPPGTRFKYSNLGYALAAQVLVHAAGRPWRELARELLPHGGAAVPGHQRDHYRSLVRPGDALRPPPAIAAPEGAGDLAATAEGLAGLLAALLGGGLLSPASLAELAAPHPPAEPGGSSYGLALKAGRRFGRRCLHHDGGHAGFHALLRVFPDDGVAGVVLVSRCSAHAPASEILDLALRPLLVGAGAPEPERLGGLAGRYSGPGRRIEVAQDGERLVLRLGGEEVPLRRLGPGRFLQARGALSEHLLRFRPDRGESWDCLTGPLRWVRDEARGEARDEGNLWPLLWAGPFPPAARRGGAAVPAGVYAHPAVGDVRLFARDGRPVFSFYYGEEVPLRRLRAGLYRIGGGLFDGERLALRGDVLDAGGMRFVRRPLRPEDLLGAEPVIP